MSQTIEVQYWSHMRGRWDDAVTSMLYSSLTSLLPELGSAEYRARWNENDAWHYVGRGPQDHTDDYTETPLAETYEDYLNSKGLIMPANPNAPAPSTPDALVDIRIAREDGKLTLSINAKPLHDMLDSVGARFTGNKYDDRPQTSFGVISSNKLSTELFLMREYPVKLALNVHYTKPPALADLKALCESGHTAVKAILTHYQPIDISYSIQKLVKG